MRNFASKPDWIERRKLRGIHRQRDQGYLTPPVIFTSPVGEGDGGCGIETDVMTSPGILGLPSLCRVYLGCAF